MMPPRFRPQQTRRTSTRRCGVGRFLAAVLVTLVLYAPASGIAAITLVEEIDTAGWELDRPTAIGVDHRGRLYIVDSGRHRVLVVDRGGSILIELGGYGWEEDRFDGPLDLVIDPGISTYVLDAGNRRVVEYDIEGNYLGVVLGESKVGTPVGLEFGSSGEFYVTDADAQIVRVFSQFGESRDPLGSFSSRGRGLVDPTRVAMGPGREIAIADPGASSVCLYDEFGSLLTQFTSGAGFAPLDVIFDHHGHLIAADPSAGTVSVFNRGDGTLLEAIGRDVLGPDASPAGLALDRTGRLLVLDGTSGSIYVFTLGYETDG